MPHATHAPEHKPNPDAPEQIKKERKEVAEEIGAEPERPREQTQRMETIRQQGDPQEKK